MLKREDLRLVSRPASIICFETVTTGGFNNIDSLSEEIKAGAFKAFQESKGAVQFSSRSQEDINIKQFYTHMHRSGIGRSRRLFITQECRLSIANGSIRNSDRVCLVSGAPVPFFLRGSIANHGQHAICHLVCDAYMYGVMYREAFDVNGDRFETILLEQNACWQIQREDFNFVEMPLPPKNSPPDASEFESRVREKTSIVATQPHLQGTVVQSSLFCIKHKFQGRTLSRWRWRCRKREQCRSAGKRLRANANRIACAYNCHEIHRFRV